MSTMNRLNVNLPKYKYDIVIYDSFSVISDEIQTLWTGQKIIIITDDIVEKLYLNLLEYELLKICSKIYSYTLPNGEKSIDRSDLVIALGGGVVEDIAG